MMKLYALFFVEGFVLLGLSFMTTNIVLAVLLDFEATLMFIAAALGGYLARRLK